MEHAVAKLYNDINNTLAVPREKSKMVSFASSITKNINLLLLPLRFPVELVMLLDQHQVLVVYLNLLLSFYYVL